MYLLHVLSLRLTYFCVVSLSVNVKLWRVWGIPAGPLCSPGSSIRFCRGSALVLRHTKVHNDICNNICQVKHVVFQSPNLPGNKVLEAGNVIRGYSSDVNLMVTDFFFFSSSGQITGLLTLDQSHLNTMACLTLARSAHKQHWAKYTFKVKRVTD